MLNVDFKGKGRIRILHTPFWQAAFACMAQRFNPDLVHEYVRETCLCSC